MSRRKLAEYYSKIIVNTALGIQYTGWRVDYETFKSDVAKVTNKGTFVIKVDQAVKGRFKKGLVALDVGRTDIDARIEKMHKKGFDHFLVEPHLKHEDSEERYLSLLRTKQGIEMNISSMGGVDIEGNHDTLESLVVSESTDWKVIAKKTGWDEENLKRLTKIFDDNHFTFLEINPYILSASGPLLLDLAVEVDDAASTLSNTWTLSDLRTPPRKLTKEEQAVAALGDSSPASFSFQIINPDGSIFVLLSGGGASVTVCDEIYSAGHGNALANYGEYSGNPTTEETYIYTSAVLQALLRSKARKKTLFIGGAVANFTDIAKTFAGITKAIDEYGKRLQDQGVRVVVRRGGPNQEMGLRNMREVLDKYGLTADVYDQSTSIDTAVKRLIKEAA